MPRHLLDIRDMTTEELSGLLDTAEDIIDHRPGLFDR